MRKEIWIAAAVFAADRVTKALASRIPAEGLELIPGVIGLRYAENTGMAFSLLSGRPWLLGMLSLAVILAGFLYLRKKQISMPAMTGLMLMLGGAAGNMFDRFVSGSVPDMIETLFISFPIFNLADTALTVGCILVMADLLFGKRGELKNE